MKMYISGAVTGQNPADVKQKFAMAAEQLASANHTPVNPLENGLSPEASWNEHMARDIFMLLESDGIYLLPDWEKSPGARIEKFIAEERGLHIEYQPEFFGYKNVFQQ